MQPEKILMDINSVYAGFYNGITVFSTYIIAHPVFYIFIFYVIAPF